MTEYKANFVALFIAPRVKQVISRKGALSVRFMNYGLNRLKSLVYFPWESIKRTSVTEPQHNA
jgi:hypothetical protein